MSHYEAFEIDKDIVVDALSFAEGEINQPRPSVSGVSAFNLFEETDVVFKVKEFD